MIDVTPQSGRLTLVPALQEEASALADLRMAAMQESLERIGRYDPERARQRLLTGFDPSCTWHVVADGQRVGLVVLKTDGDEWLLDHLYVHPLHQGRGWGSAVLRWVCSRADEQGRPVRLGALRDSDANRFYLRHGFEELSRGLHDVYYRRMPR